MALPEYLNRDPQTEKLRKSKRQEKSAARDYGGRTVGGSGSGREKADVNTPDVKLECKRTDKASMSLKREWLEKVFDQAYSSGRVPALEIEFEGGGREPARWVMIESRLFKEVLNCLQDRQ